MLAAGQQDGTETGAAADGTGGSATSSREHRRPWPSSRPHRRRRRPQDDVIAQIEKLSALHQSGALTDEEFAAAKAKLLG